MFVMIWICGSSLEFRFHGVCGSHEIWQKCVGAAYINW